jgi:vanillate O-demethylase ferredoxin subunit
MKTIAARVLQKHREAEGIVSLELAGADGDPLPPFTAGSHIDLHVRPGLVRQYSLYNDPQECHRYLIAVVRDPASRGGSAAIHEEIRAGDLLRISEPRNHFPLVRSRRSLLFAGGIGVTPLLCMAQRLAHIHADFEMHYCTRSPQRTAFRDRIAASDLASRVHFHFDDGDEDQLLDVDEVLGIPDDSTHLYVCGPDGFMAHVLQAARAHGWLPQNIHYEYFGAPPLDRSGDTPFDVIIASSGETVRIPSGKTVIEILQQHDIDIEASCQQGVCGTCVTRLLDGVPEHRDRILTAEQKARNDQFTPCRSRAKSPALVLDL